MPGASALQKRTPQGGHPLPLDLRRDFNLDPSMSAAVLGPAINRAVQVAIANGRALSLGRDAWRVDRPILIDGPMTLCSDGLYGDFGAENYSGSVSSSSTPLRGGVIVQTTAATDGIQITCSGTSVHLRDVGVQFDSSIAFTNTGNGITALPPNASGQGYPRHGLFYSQWRNLWVYGHDGNHYAFDITNGILNLYEGLYAAGGGGLRLTGSPGAPYNYGNAKVLQTSFSVCAGGSAHGIMLAGPSGGSFLNFISLDRVGVYVGNTAPGATTPTAAQKALTYSGNVQRCMIAHSTLENNVGGVNTLIPPKTALGAGNYGLVISPIENFTGPNLLMLTTVTLNPTSSAAATAYAEVSNNAGFTSPVEIARVTAPANSVAGQQQVLPFTILTDYAWYRVTCTNATINYSHSLPVGTLKLP
jgi:hypothetical protein